MPGDPVSDTAKQKPPTTSCAMSAHHHKVGIGRVPDDAFGRVANSDSGLDLATWLP
jgi:hypothetical protein